MIDDMIGPPVMIPFRTTRKEDVTDSQDNAYAFSPYDPSMPI